MADLARMPSFCYVMACALYIVTLRYALIVIVLRRCHCSQLLHLLVQLVRHFDLLCWAFGTSFLLDWICLFRVASLLGPFWPLG